MELTIQDWGMMIGKKVQFIEYTGEKGIGFLTGITKDIHRTPSLWIDYDYEFDLDSCKPIMRTVDQMTEKEFQEFNKIAKFKDTRRFYCLSFFNLKDSPEKIKWLIQNGFDVFNWINQNLAIKQED